jgi:hypothetical protein
VNKGEALPRDEALPDSAGDAFYSSRPRVLELATDFQEEAARIAKEALVILSCDNTISIKVPSRLMCYTLYNPFVCFVVLSVQS